MSSWVKVSKARMYIHQPLNISVMLRDYSRNKENKMELQHAKGFTVRNLHCK